MNTSPLMQTAHGTILCAATSESTSHTMQRALGQTFDLIHAHNGLQVLEKVRTKQDISCIVMDLNLATINGMKTLHLLKSHYRTFHIPIIILTENASNHDIALAVEMGADDFMAKPIDPLLLQTRITMNLARSKRDQSVHPLTNLAGSITLNRLIAQRLNQPLSIIYCDIDHFKAYNDYYGFARGDGVLKSTAQLIGQCIDRSGSSQDFLAHIGGDDFVVLTTPERASPIARDICTTFDERVIKAYAPQDQEKRFITVEDRTGKPHDFGIMSLSLAIISNHERPFGSLLEIGQIAAELKRYAKSKPDGKIGSSFVIDRRRK